MDINPYAARLVPSPSPTESPTVCASQEAAVWHERYERWKSGSLDAHDDADLIRAAALWYAHKMAYLLERGR